MEIFYQYTIGQINFETLGLLFSLMSVVAGITKLGYIDNFTTFKKNQNIVFDYLFISSHKPV